MNDNEILVEIWSDVMCPFCYIGKRKFEKALSKFPQQENVKIIWKSYQLSPDMVTNPNSTVDEYLAVHKGVSQQQAKAMNDRVTEMAANEGLVYNMDKAIPANSFRAHQFLHFALENGLQNEAEEKLFAAYFTEGKNTDDLEVLCAIGKEIGLDISTLKQALENEMYASAVNKDIEEAKAIGVRGVPFFVINRKYAVSGAQPVDVFLSTLNKVIEYA